MNIQITAKAITDVSAYLAEGAARHRRLMSPPAKRPVAPVALPKPVEKPKSQRPYRAHDAHVHDWHKWRASAGSPMRTYIMARCEEIGIPYDVIVSQRKTADIAHPRQMLMWEIKTQVKPSISYPELGRLFGGRDHTTALHAVRKHAKRIGA